MSTITQKETLKVALDQASPGKLADALAKARLGTMLTPVEWDSGVITSSAIVTLPGMGALYVQSVRVVAGAESNTPHVVCDSSETPGAIVTGLYSVAVSVDGKTLTFSTTVDQVIVRYIPNSATALTDSFARS